ncbi:hypothetical protein [uncultured Arcobacter sp.]|uniref:hypothetical protein n=1 Tax=uncultured Arcobacter sp. TaxID=165434 RepID=UPI002606F078|nr:hypothetical protein [uncultured Arcobacter sp.]
MKVSDMTFDDCYITIEINDEIEISLLLEDMYGDGYLMFHCDTLSQPFCWLIDIDKKFRKRETAEKHARTQIKKMIRMGCKWLKENE